MSLSTNIQDLAIRIATEVKSVRTLVNGNAADNSALLTTHKGNLIGAINELKGAVDSAAQSGGASINDTAIGTSTTWSSTKIDSQINEDVDAAITALVDGADPALDTLRELAEALANAATDEEVGAIVTALEHRVRFDEAQTLTEGERSQARSNIGAGTSDLEIGTTDSTAKAGDYHPTWDQVSSKPTNFPPSTHGHAWGEISNKPLTFAPSAHDHASTDISDSTVPGRAVLTANTNGAILDLIGAVSKGDIGDSNFDFVATFEAGLE